MTRTSLALAALLAFCAPALAGGGLEYSPPAAPAAPDLGALVTRLVLLTVALVGLCFAVLWFARRANRPAGGTGDGGGRLILEGTLPLDRTSAVHVVTADGLQVAVTTDATGLRSLVLLAERFDDALARATGAEAEGEKEEPPAPEATPAVPATPVTRASADDVRQLLERLVRRADRPGVHLEPALRDDQP